LEPALDAALDPASELDVESGFGERCLVVVDFDRRGGVAGHDRPGYRVRLPARRLLGPSGETWRK
jgi:hypothetical protein